MKKYGEFMLIPWEDFRWLIAIRLADYQVDLKAGGINLYGVIVREVRTYEKAYRVVRYYEKRMGRIQ